MALTAAEAADIARKHGLTLQDAAGLLALADTADEADTIAARFATPEADDAARAIARQLFGERREDPDVADLDEHRRFTRRLFRDPDSA